MAYEKEPKGPPVEAVLGFLAALLSVVAAGIALVKANRKRQQKY